MPKGVAKDPARDRRKLKIDPESIWIAEEPPADQIEAHDKMKGMPKGAWGKFLKFCTEHPNQTRRSHPIMRKQTAVNAASEIKKWKLISGQMKLGVTAADGEWITHWGHAPDANDLENWYVWVKWVPKKKVARTPKKAQTNGKAKSATKKAGSSVRTK